MTNRCLIGSSVRLFPPYTRVVASTATRIRTNALLSARRTQEGRSHAHTHLNTSMGLVQSREVPLVPQRKPAKGLIPVPAAELHLNLAQEDGLATRVLTAAGCSMASSDSSFGCRCAPAVYRPTHALPGQVSQSVLWLSSREQLQQVIDELRQHDELLRPRTHTEQRPAASEDAGIVTISGTVVPDDGTTPVLTTGSTFVVAHGGSTASEITWVVRSRPKGATRLDPKEQDPIEVSFYGPGMELVAFLSAEQSSSFWGRTRVYERGPATLYAREPPDGIEFRTLATKTLADGRVMYAVARLVGRYGASWAVAGQGFALGLYPLERHGTFHLITQPSLIMHAADGVIKSSEGEAVAWTRGTLLKKSAARVAAGVDVALVLALIAEMEIRAQGPH